MASKKLALIVTLIGFCLVLALNGCGGSSDDGDVARFVGTYSGTFSGGDSGTFTMVVNNVGTLTGSGNSSSDGAFNFTGVVEDNGDVTFGIATTGASFTGEISVNGAVSGSWVNGAINGIFSGSRQ